MKNVIMGAPELLRKVSLYLEGSSRLWINGQEGRGHSR